MSHSGEQLNGLIDTWIAAVGWRDVDRLVGLYAEDAQFWGTMGASLCCGRAEIRDYFLRFLDRHWMQVSLLDVHWSRRSELLLAAGSYRFRWQDRPDRDEVDARARFSFVLGPTPEGARILQHHSSAWVVGGL
ncbi:MAG: nuclear transport factor 2 family protein [Wenzhouxiangella sp.]